MRLSTVSFRASVLTGVGAASLLIGAQVRAEEMEQAAGSEPEVEEIVVTGNVAGSSARPSAAVSVLRSAEIQQIAPLSAADLLKNVPGVFVNSALGEVRNIVYSRGVSANSSDGANGYYYVSLQEDGLPVTNVTFNNFGPDFFYRQDLSLARLEALRGGTAVVTGPNAPGGIFNYISRSGRSDPGVEVSGRFGLEGNGKNPYYRVDAFAAGQLADTLYYSIGGFYRDSTGARDPGYSLNRGGQIKANLLWDYGSGTVQLYGKYLDDRNGFFEFVPARNFNDPKAVPELGNAFSPLPPKSGRHRFNAYIGAPEQSWDPSKLAHSKSTTIGLKIDHEFGDGWSISNNLKYADNRADWTTGAVIFPLAIDDPVLNVFLNALRPGAYTYTDRSTGNIVAQLSRNAAGQINVVSNSLPNQSVLQNGVLSQVAYSYEPSVEEWMDQLSITKRFDTMSFKLGAFFATSGIELINGGGGIGLSPLVDNPDLLDITYTGPSGTVQQLTDPSGFTAIGQRAVRNTGRQKQLSIFFGHDWTLTDRLSIDWGARYEKIRVKGANQTSIANPRCFDPTYGGADNNVDTLYDNCQTTLSAPLRYDHSLDYFSFSGAMTYRFDDRNIVYARYSQGKKAPDFAFFITLDTPAEIDNVRPVSQKVQQIELGYRHNGDRFHASVSPFYSKLSRVGTTQVFQNADGSFYTPPTLFATTETWGVEIEGDVDVTDSVNLRTAVTVQDPQSRNFAVWIANGLGPADDSISAVPDGDADNNAKLMATTTLRFTPSDRFTSFLTWKYMGARAANRFNTFDLPAFSQIDIGATYNFTEKVSISANINNVLNGKGVMSWAPAGGLVASLDRQAFTPAQRAANEDQLFNIITIQPRAFFVSGKVKF